MGAIASQITSLTIVYSTVYSGADQRKHESSASLAFVCREFTGDRGPQMASNAENVSIWWRHHEIRKRTAIVSFCLYDSPRQKNFIFYEDARDDDIQYSWCSLYIALIELNFLFIEYVSKSKTPQTLVLRDTYPGGPMSGLEVEVSDIAVVLCVLPL